MKRLSIGQRIRNGLLLVGTGVACASVSVNAAIDASITNIVEETEGFFGVLVPVKALIVGTGIAIGLVKFLRGR